MIIRVYEDRDFDQVKRLHESSGLPAVCMPDLQSPLFCVKLCAEKQKRITQAGFLKLTAEAFVLVDREAGTPGERWATLQELTAATLAEAYARGLDDVTAWVPPALEKGFGRRLIELGWIRSPWQSYSALLR
jgi:hypothetical protein